MYQKDYILRMIEMLDELIASIFGLIRMGNNQQAEERLEKLFCDMMKHDTAFFRSIPRDKLIGELLEKHSYTIGHLEILAELFNAEAELSLAKGNETTSLESSEKSLLLFEFIDIQQKTFSHKRLELIKTIRERVLKIQTLKRDPRT